ncbi:MAG: hypothetical protein IPP91_15780 [Betaproteobacteria bacterium]|nr:hypothetical protein [Betaproteobacteria bacterium]
MMTRVAVCAVAALVVAGCSDLLPKASSEVSSPWHSFEEAQHAIEKIVPYKTTTMELKAAGIDPYVTPNVQLLSYSDIVLRFPFGSMPMERLDRGLRECLEAGKGCQGYFISVRETKRDRVGNFWLDALSFYRVIDVQGWSFNALILTVEDRVVYVIQGGQPVIRELETNKQPLGPLQGWGDALPGFIK